MSKTKKIKDLISLYDTLLEHTSNLCKVTLTVEETINNLDQINELNEFHKKTREFAKVLLAEDLSNLSSNFMFKTLLSKDITPMSIKFINLITFYNETIIECCNNSDTKKIEETIKDLHDFNKVAKGSFKVISIELKKLV